VKDDRLRATCSGVPCAMMRRRLSAFWPEVDDVVGGLDDVEVVLDHDTVLPWSTSLFSTSSSLRVSSKCSPVVGSSRM